MRRIRPAMELQNATNTPPIPLKWVLAIPLLAGVTPWVVVRLHALGVDGVSNPLLWIAAAGVIRLLGSIHSESDRPIVLVAVVVALGLSATPFQAGSAAALFILGIACAALPNGNERHLGALLICLALHLSSNAVWAGFVSEALLNIEVASVAHLVDAVRGPTMVTGNLLALSDRRELLVLRECSSIQILGPAVVGGLSISALLAQNPRRLWPRLALVVAMVFLLNQARLLAMAWSDSGYRWLHDGGGAEVFSALCVGLATVILMRRRDG